MNDATAFEVEQQGGRGFYCVLSCPTRADNTLVLAYIAPGNVHEGHSNAGLVWVDRAKVHGVHKMVDAVSVSNQRRPSVLGPRPFAASGCCHCSSGITFCLGSPEQE